MCSPFTAIRSAREHHKHHLYRLRHQPPMTVAVSHLLLSLTSLSDLGSPIVVRGPVASHNVDKDSLCNLVANPNVDKDNLYNLLISPKVDKDSLCILLSPIMICGLLASPSVDKESIIDLCSHIVDRARLPLASHILDRGLLASSSVGMAGRASQAPAPGLWTGTWPWACQKVK